MSNVQTSQKFIIEKGPSLEGMTPDEYILTLARMFPCLQCKIEGMTEFDGDDFFARLSGCSTYQWHAGMFILNVWCPGDAEAKGWRFDYFAAFPGWDSECRRAFLGWCANPRWP